MKASVISAVLTGVFSVACAPINMNVTTQVPIPAQFDQTARARSSADVARWWQSWSDPVLSRLIERGLQANHHLAEIRANVAAARASAALAQSELGPSVGVEGGISGHNVQADNPLSDAIRADLVRSGSSLANGSQRLKGHDETIGFAASWEPDIFGGKRSDAAAARYASLGMAEQWHGAQMVLVSDIADNYVRVRSLQQRIRIGHQTLNTLKELQRYTVGRFRAGQATDYDVQAVGAKYSAVAAQLATLQAQADGYQRSIAVLTGQSPQQFVLPASSIDILAHLPDAPTGQMPLDVLNRRPDVRAQEQAVKARSAQLASAKADLLPRFNIEFLWQTGHVHLDSDVPGLKGFGGLVAADVSLPVFTSGRIKHNIEASDARLQAALAQYDQTILNALAEVDSSYQLQYSLNRQNQLLTQALSKAQKQAHSADQLFRYGNLTLDRTLNAHLDESDLADRQVQGRLAEAQNLLNVYKTLGGGWSEASPNPDTTVAGGNVPQ